MTNEELWQTVLAQIQFSVSRTNFATWFKNTYISKKESGKAVISTENAFSKEWLKNKYYSQILKLLRENDDEIKTIDFEVNPSLKSKYSPLMFGKNILKSKKGVYGAENQLSFQEFNIDKNTNLNPKYNFDNFIVGRFNELAQAAGWAISESPGAVYNPLFIYGGVGLGKTHLLQAIGNKINSQFSNKKIQYIPCEKFVSGIIDSIKSGTISEFKKELKLLDVLIMDDIQFFAGKDKSQEEFFHIFNMLYQSQKQIVLSSDRPPKSIPAIEERLRSRFEGGMIIDIGKPDVETKAAILKEKCSEKEEELPDDIINYLAVNINSNIRELEGALNRVLFFKKRNKINNIDENSVKTFLENIIKKPKKTTNFKNIIKVITETYNLKEKEILENNRRKEIVRPRQIAMYLLREELNESYPSIGRKFGGKDHTTAIYACSKISQKIEEDNGLLAEINIIKQKLYGGLSGEMV